MGPFVMQLPERKLGPGPGCGPCVSSTLSDLPCKVLTGKQGFAESNRRKTTQCPRGWSHSLVRGWWPLPATPLSAGPEAQGHSLAVFAGWATRAANKVACSGQGGEGTGTSGAPQANTNLIQLCVIQMLKEEICFFQHGNSCLHPRLASTQNPCPDSVRSPQITSSVCCHLPEGSVGGRMPGSTSPTRTPPTLTSWLQEKPASSLDLCALPRPPRPSPDAVAPSPEPPTPPHTFSGHLTLYSQQPP